MSGIHLIIDGVISQSIGKDDVEGILFGLAAEIGMKILAGPTVVEGAPENPGWTGFVIIDKSHIAVHTFKDERAVIEKKVAIDATFNANNVFYLSEMVQQGFQKSGLARQGGTVIRDFYVHDLVYRIDYHFDAPYRSLFWLFTFSTFKQNSGQET